MYRNLHEKSLKSNSYIANYYKVSGTWDHIQSFVVLHKTSVLWSCFPLPFPSQPIRSSITTGRTKKQLCGLVNCIYISLKTQLKSPSGKTELAMFLRHISNLHL